MDAGSDVEKDVPNKGCDAPETTKKADCVLPPRLHVTADGFATCSQAVALLKRTQPSILHSYVPVFVVGDGNCLFRAVSLACYGSEDYHDTLRQLAATEMLQHPQWYDAERVDSRHPLRNEPDILLPQYEEACCEVSWSGQAVGVTAVLALSAVIGYPIHTFWPPLSGSLTPAPLSRQHTGRGVTGSTRPVHVMWSTTGSVPKHGEVHINHFVPLLPKCVPATDGSAINLTESPDQEHDAENGDDDIGKDVFSDAGTVQVDTAVANTADDVVDGVNVHVDSGSKRAHTDDFDDPPAAKSHCTQYAVNASVADSYDDCNQQQRPQLHGDNVKLPFKTAAELHELLSGTQQVQVHAEVPRGPKSNACFVIDNSVNVSRRAAGQRSVFWDDCGAWNSKDGRNVTTQFMRNGNVFTVVKVHDGKVCKRQRVDKKQAWVPLPVQPETDAIVSMCSYYATLKADAGYRKRVTWLVSQPTVAVYEYQGTAPPVNAAHGLQRKTENEFVRSKPKVLRKIRAGLQERNAQPKQVYDHEMLLNESSDRPRDHKQVRNVAQALAGESGHRKKFGNVADDVQNVLTSVQTHAFVKEVSVRHGMSPVILCYTDEQISDLKRFCSSKTPTFLRTVLGVDRTFNLGPCFVTVSVYRNVSVVRKSTVDNPIFLGPVMFHFDGKAETYRRFFSTLSDLLCGDVSCAELAGDAELVFGSDDEKAMVGALRHVFPNAEHVFCARHLEENVRRFLTDVAGMATRDREQVLERVREATRVDADQTEQCESVLTSLLEAVRASAPSTTVPGKVLSYFEDRILPKLRNNLRVTSNSMCI